MCGKEKFKAKEAKGSHSSDEAPPPAVLIKPPPPRLIIAARGPATRRRRGRLLISKPASSPWPPGPFFCLRIYRTLRRRRKGLSLRGVPYLTPFSLARSSLVAIVFADRPFHPAARFSA
ncbi:Hypothetical protein NTJ_03830 [Nesidiocoris tenuis]|uniref:Uncharacterized protein n=1 Tax=Nesidiocoris tenuis TaxID=355587 RepID=A0ABN7AJG2_9HEMI|nr:Hypothetical protein NTJ_03830 [Nesidiocoris tenuis]